MVLNRLFLLISLLLSFVKADIDIDKQMLSQLQTGDIIFRKENSFLSDRFEKFGGKGFSHIGVVYMKDKKPYIVHIERNSKNDDLKVDTLSYFLRDATKFIFKRLKKDKQPQMVSEYIANLIKTNPKFDFYFDMKSNDELYCTEMIYKLYLDIYHIKLTTKFSDYGFYHFISVGDIFDSRYLKNLTIVK